MQTSRGRDRPKTDRTYFSCVNHGHFSSDKNFPARGRKCKGCGKEDHFIACCSKNKNKGKRNASRGKLDGVGSTSVEFIKLQVDAVSSKRIGESKYVQCTVANRLILLLLNTGARVNILNRESVAKLQLTVQPATDIHLRANGGSPITILGAVETSVSCGDHTVKNFMFVVVDKGSNVMGIELSEEMHFSVSIPTELLNSHAINVNSVEQSRIEKQLNRNFRQQFSDLFGPPEEIIGFQHRPKVDHSVAPMAQAYWRMPLALQPEMISELERMVVAGILEPIDASEWVSNTVIVRKPSGGLRICCNLADVNKATIAGRYPLPTIDDLGRVFNGSQYFSKLDLRGTYLQVSLHPEVRHMMAMVTPLGLLQWTRLPMGLCSASSCFQKILVNI